MGTSYHIPLLVAVGLATHGLRKGSLSSSGAVAAFLVGYGHLANPLKVFGVTLIFFYLAGSRVTKVGYGLTISRFSDEKAAESRRAGGHDRGEERGWTDTVDAWAMEVCED